MKNQYDALNYAIKKVTRPAGPECCDQEMQEIESSFTNEINEYEVVGYECTKCGYKMDLTGKEID